MAPPGKKEATSADVWLIEEAEQARADRAEGPEQAEDDFASVAPPPPEEESVAENVGAETMQWLAVPEAGANGANPAEVRRDQKPEPAPAAAKKAVPAEKAEPAAEKAEPPKPPAKKTEGARPAAKKATAGRGVNAKLEKAQELVQRQKEEISELGGRVRELQTQLRVQAKEAKEELTRAIKERDSLGKRVAQLEAQVGKLESGLAAARKRVAAGVTRRSTSAPAKKAAAASPKAKPRSAPKNGKLDLNSATFEQLRGLGLSVTQSARLIAYRDVRGGYESLDELDDVPGLSEETRGDLRAALKLGA